MHTSEDGKRAVLDALRAMAGEEDADTLARRTVTEDFQYHSARSGVKQGHEGFADSVRALRRGFPDFRIEVDDVVAEGDRVVVRTCFTGTNDGPFAGPPTGRCVRMAQVHVFRLREGRIADHWTCMDELGALVQLGVLVPPARARPDHACQTTTRTRRSQR
jgi:steroid delta-isomerase-like uncharacterized protein